MENAIRRLLAPAFGLALLGGCGADPGTTAELDPAALRSETGQANSNSCDALRTALDQAGSAAARAAILDNMVRQGCPPPDNNPNGSTPPGGPDAVDAVTS